MAAPAALEAQGSVAKPALASGVTTKTSAMEAMEDILYGSVCAHAAVQLPATPFTNPARPRAS